MHQNSPILLRLLSRRNIFHINLKTINYSNCTLNSCNLFIPNVDKNNLKQIEIFQKQSLLCNQLIWKTNLKRSLTSSRSSTSFKLNDDLSSDSENENSDQSTIVSNDKKSNYAELPLVKIDEEILSKEFAQSLGKNQLTNLENVWKDVPPLTLQNVINDYSKLAKIRLTGLVVLTTLAGYYMGLNGAVNPTTLAATLIGTGLTSGSAAAWNHFLEVPFDSQMKRTQNRPLVQGTISPLHAASFALVSGVCGLTILALGVNPLTATLGATNLLLYSFVYTPMKRVHIVNTWIGAIVGAIPPVMGFTAVNNFIDLPSILLGLVLYSWQFPHFNALSWNMRHEYARAGYRMMSVTDPKLCQNTALRHSIFLLAYTGILCSIETTNWTFFFDSMPFSLYLIYLSFRFCKEPSSQTSRKLFFYSLVYLPVVLLLMIISKNHHKKSKGQSKVIKDKVNINQSSQQQQLVS